MADRVFNVLFLCTGNSARSIYAESIINRLGRGRFHGYSAGSHPNGEVHPMALHELRHNNYSPEGLRIKDWDEFGAGDALHMDFVFTVCDTAAAEVCPVWPGQPVSAHWGVADPAAVAGDDMAKRTAFATAFREMQHRISVFVNLPFDALDRLRLQERLDEIGRSRVADIDEPVVRS